MARIPGIRKVLASDFAGAPAWFEPVVGVINSFLDTVIGALRGKLTIEDNLYSQVRTLTFVNGVETQVLFLDLVSYQGILILQGPQTDSNDYCITGWRARVVKPGVLGITILFNGAGTTSGLVKFAILG